MRRKTMEQLLEKETNAVILENMLGDEQLRRRRLEEELIQARNDHVKEKERLEKELAETERILNIARHAKEAGMRKGNNCR